MIREEVRLKELEFPYVVIRPDIVKDNLPLVIMLHGAGERGDGSNLSLVDINGFQDEHIEKVNKDFILVKPQCPKDSFWVANIPYIKSFILKIAEKYHCDKSKISLSGLSMGGYGTWYTAMAYPDMFYKIAPCCGGGMAWNADTLTMPVRAFHGEKDDIVNPIETKDMVNAMKELNLDVEATYYEDCGHNSWEKAFNEELLEWLIS